mmetsp:Transcript_131784/g.294903  ORF Transcript_131784/g.294903 Transcript_131784/m.294903 type:complete len:208 (-) Transcript_131784:332-955(-)
MPARFVQDVKFNSGLASALDLCCKLSRARFRFHGNLQFLLSLLCAHWPFRFIRLFVVRIPVPLLFLLLVLFVFPIPLLLRLLRVLLLVLPLLLLLFLLLLPLLCPLLGVLLRRLVGGNSLLLFLTLFLFRHRFVLLRGREGVEGPLNHAPPLLGAIWQLVQKLRTMLTAGQLDFATLLGARIEEDLASILRARAPSLAAHPEQSRAF